MQAAFIDIGLERNGFLYVNDAVLDLEARRSNDDEESRADVRGAPVADIAEVLKAGKKFSFRSKRNHSAQKAHASPDISLYRDGPW